MSFQTKAFEALMATSYKHQGQLDLDRLWLPTIRILKQGESVDVGLHKVRDAMGNPTKLDSGPELN